MYQHLNNIMIELILLLVYRSYDSMYSLHSDLIDDSEDDDPPPTRYCTVIYCIITT